MCFLLTFLYKKRINDQPWIEDESNLYQDGDSTRVSLDCNFIDKVTILLFCFYTAADNSDWSVGRVVGEALWGGDSKSGEF